MKKILLSITLLSTALFSIAQQRTEAEAAAIAKAFMQNNGYEFNITKSMAPAKILTQKAGDIVPYYIFNDTRKGGFVIVGGQEAMSDILAYSDEDCFDTGNVPPAAAQWLEVYSQCAIAAADNPEASMAQKKAAAKAFAKSNFSHRQNVEPLLGEIKYNQGEPYNRRCPMLESSGGNRSRALTGCTQTAEAMIMRYWKHPARPSGNKSYSFYRPDAPSQYMTLSLDFDNEAPYQWDKILPRYEGHTYTDEQADAISALMYHCGIANSAEYGLSITNAAISHQRMVDIFDYASDIVVDSYTYYKEKPGGDNEFRSSLIDEIGQRRPILAGGWSADFTGGHYYVIDGYDLNNLLHFNLGWNGSSNGYYEVVPVPQVPYGYNMYVIRHIHPNGRLTPTSPVRRVVVEAGLGADNEQTANINSTLKTLTGNSKYSESLIFITTIDCKEEADKHLEGLGNIQGVLIDRCDTVTGTISTSAIESVYKNRYNSDAPANIDIDAVFASESSMKVSVASLFPNNIENADYRYAFVYTENNVKLGGNSYNNIARGTFPDNKGYENSIPANIEKDKEYIFEQEIPLPMEIDNIDNATLIVMMLDAESGEIVNANTVALKEINAWREKQKPSFYGNGKILASGNTLNVYNFDEKSKCMYAPVRLDNPLYEPMEVTVTAEVIELGENAEMQLGETAGTTSVTYSLAPLGVDSTMMLFLNISDEYKSSKSSIKLTVSYKGKSIATQTVNFDFIESIEGINAFTVRTAGSLGELVPASIIDTLTTISVGGRLSGKDIAFLRDSLGAKVIDLSRASIVAGPGAYYNDYTAENDIIGIRMFIKATTEQIILPATAKKIDNYAFHQCASLTNVVIGENVTTIGNYAFNGCKSLAKVRIPASVQELGRNTFKECPITCFICESETPPTSNSKTFDSETIAKATLVVPTEAAVATYKAANVWKTFGTIISYDEYLTAIVPVAEDATVTVKNGIIKIDGNAEVTIYTFAGKLAAKGRAGEYTLPAGNYIVKAGGKAVKVTIR